MHTLNYLFWEILVSSAHTTFAISIILKTTPTRPGQFSDASYIIDSGSGNLYGNCFAEALIHISIFKKAAVTAGRNKIKPTSCGLFFEENT